MSAHEVPPLVPTNPPCPLCDDVTGFDGTSYWCEECGATWDVADGFTAGEIEGGRCRSTIVASERFDWPVVAGRVYRCSYLDGHDEGRYAVVHHQGTRIDADAPPLHSDEAGLVWHWRDDEPGVHVLEEST